MISCSWLLHGACAAAWSSRAPRAVQTSWHGVLHTCGGTDTWCARSALHNAGTHASWMEASLGQCILFIRAVNCCYKGFIPHYCVRVNSMVGRSELDSCCIRKEHVRLRLAGAGARCAGCGVVGTRLPAMPGCCLVTRACVVPRQHHAHAHAHATHAGTHDDHPSGGTDQCVLEAVAAVGSLLSSGCDKAGRSSGPSV